MMATVRALFEHLLDYAGLFPPAKLSLPEALRRYASYVSGPRQWLMGRFVCPAGRLAELTQEARVLRMESGLQVAVLGQSATSADEFLARLGDDVAAIEQFRRAWGWPDVADVLELPLPAAANAELLAGAAARIGPLELRTFFEVAAGPEWSERVRTTCQAVAALSGPFGLKVRCGGLSAEAFPSEERLAEFMVRCRDARLPWKATAGLHHPLRHRDAGIGVLMHGFLNVFGAGLLSYAHPLTEAQLVEVLRDEQGSQFWFQNDRFGWGPWGCSLRQVTELRRRYLPSFGSCSVEEPYADLVALGMVPAERDSRD